ISDTPSARPQRFFEVDGGYVVLCAAADGLTIAQRLSKASQGRHLTLAVPVPDEVSAAQLDEIAAQAAHACTRIVIYESEVPGRHRPGPASALLARAIRSSARIECGVVLDGSRALRHCIDGMAAGDIIVYCCDEPQDAVEILQEYGARPIVRIGVRPNGEARSGVVATGSCRTAADATRARLVGGV
ncbi:MAG: hypothetical protein ACXWC3_18020, partial [Burkholderiales bacterium]